jgi:hypothetical protein
MVVNAFRNRQDHQLMPGGTEGRLSFDGTFRTRDHREPRESRRALDVWEYKGDGTRGQLVHFPPLSDHKGGGRLRALRETIAFALSAIASSFGGEMERQEDAIGQAMLDYLETGGGEEIVERDDGFIIMTDAPADYFAPYDEWPQVEQQAMDFVQGRVLDVGCGAGRGSLELQRRGHEVVAIDVSPGAIEVCQRRGVKDARVLGIEDIGPELGIFDTILLLA